MTSAHNNNPKICERIDPLLDGLIDGVLAVGTRKRVMDHLHSCANCHRRRADLLTLRKLTKNFPENSVSADFCSRVKESLWDRSRIKVEEETKKAKSRFVLPLPLVHAGMMIAGILAAFFCYGLGRLHEAQTTADESQPRSTNEVAMATQEVEKKVTEDRNRIDIEDRVNIDATNDATMLKKANATALKPVIVDDVDFSGASKKLAEIESTIAKMETMKQEKRRAQVVLPEPVAEALGEAKLVNALKDQILAHVPRTTVESESTDPVIMQIAEASKDMDGLLRAMHKSGGRIIVHPGKETLIFESKGDGYNIRITVNGLGTDNPQISIKDLNEALKRHIGITIPNVKSHDKEEGDSKP